MTKFKISSVQLLPCPFPRGVRLAKISVVYDSCFSLVNAREFLTEYDEYNPSRYIHFLGIFSEMIVVDGIKYMPDHFSPVAQVRPMSELLGKLPLTIAGIATPKEMVIPSDKLPRFMVDSFIGNSFPSSYCFKCSGWDLLVTRSEICPSTNFIVSKVERL